MRNGVVKHTRERLPPLSVADSPIYRSLLVDNTMGLLSSYPAIEPQLSDVDDCAGSKQSWLNNIPGLKRGIYALRKRIT